MKKDKTKNSYQIDLRMQHFLLWTILFIVVLTGTIGWKYLKVKEAYQQEVQTKLAYCRENCQLRNEVVRLSNEVDKINDALIAEQEN